MGIASKGEGRSTMLPALRFGTATVAALRLIAMLAALSVANGVRAQEVAGTAPAKAPDEGIPNKTAGEFTPGRGFDVYESDLASLNISAYGLFRYVNQLPDSQTFVDHLGRERQVRARNDINWHRTMVWLTGFFFTKDFRYNITLWSLPTTQQTLLFGNLQYSFNPNLYLGVGLAPNRTIRSVQGSWPFWAGSDRQMAEEYFRGGFSSGAFIGGRAHPRLNYFLSVNTNLSQLGITATNDSRDLAVSGSLEWLPTTGEFGPRGGFGDLEYHVKVATRFGISAGHAREYRAAPDDQPPNETQLRISDGVLVFEEGALADSVTIRFLDYDNIAIDAGVKYRGFSFQSEYYLRWLSDFDADVPFERDAIFDHGFMAEGMYMVVPKRVGVYLVGGMVFDEFDRDPWEIGAGVSVYPSGTRSWRLNLHLLRVEKSPTGSNFGYYAAGQSGTIISIGTDILL